ncbi:hypothetical protein HMN09_00990200 [Mycena chlorophos]|uniref:BTB domain-containing protein n=1 Tax=Mycena chlorophos TaxID=658473 RepID=A0A8H6SHR1_MYCCL|nr:hypothetical protein HMN09_00990200 [Mycena chlorophos]
MSPRFIIDGSTIRETRDPGESERPRKRPRQDSSDSPLGSYSSTWRFVDTGTTWTSDVVMDEEFYREDGDCKIRVGKTGFLVHRRHLVEASPVLKQIIESYPPDCVVSLVVDVDEFRALCWALYATPEAIFTAAVQDHDTVSRLLLLASATHQFRCSALSSLVHSSLRTIISSPSFSASCSSALFTRFVDTAVKTRNDALLEATVTTWSARLQTNDIPCVPAILAADTHDLSTLRGVAYYHHVQTLLAEEGTNSRGATVFRTEQLTKLSNAQVTRLLSGHWSLVSLCEQLKRRAVAFVGPEGCAGQCSSVWMERWAAIARSERVGGLRAAALLRLLGAIRQMATADAEIKARMCEGCRQAALDALEKRALELEDGLADHFFGWL